MVGHPKTTRDVCSFFFFIFFSKLVTQHSPWLYHVFNICFGFSPSLNSRTSISTRKVRNSPKSYNPAFSDSESRQVLSFNVFGLIPAPWMSSTWWELSNTASTSQAGNRSGPCRPLSDYSVLIPTLGCPKCCDTYINEENWNQVGKLRIRETSVLFVKLWVESGMPDSL